MILIIIFIISGAGLILLMTAKRLEQRGTTLFILGAISLGDARARRLYHESIRSYSETKEKLLFLVEKQLPLRAKNLWNKSTTYLKDRVEKSLGDIRGSRLLKKSDGLSEFFKNISDIEKGKGEINDVLEE